MQRLIEHRFLIPTVLLCATLVVYLPAIGGGFVWDDDDHVTRNRALRTPAGLVEVWTEVGATPQYYPLVFTTFWIEYQLWGPNPLPFHLLNVLLPIAAVLWKRNITLVAGAFVAAEAAGTVLFAVAFRRHVLPKLGPRIGPLLRGGPAELVRHYTLPHDEGYADACHLCYEARRMLRSRFPDVLCPDQVYGEYDGP